jgi:hypothetical protein
MGRQPKLKPQELDGNERRLWVYSVEKLRLVDFRAFQRKRCSIKTMV